jgi:hypothetical protein
MWRARLRMMFDRPSTYPSQQLVSTISSDLRLYSIDTTGWTAGCEETTAEIKISGQKGLRPTGENSQCDALALFCSCSF